jgi:hypothetical protein
MRSTLCPTLLASFAAAVAATEFVASPAARPLSAAASPIEGRWKASLTRASLLRTGNVDPVLAAQLYGPWTAQFANGRFQARNERTGRGASGTFRVSGKLVRFVFATGIGLEPGDVGFCNASVYRDRLTFTRLPGRPCRWEDAVWTRVS